MSVLLPGAEPWSAEGGPGGALVLHGFTGNPSSVRGVAEALAGAGLAVELPRLPGHGTDVGDMLGTTWDDWLGEAEAAWRRLAGRVERTAVVGLSMGGALACRLAVDHPEVAGLVLVNPAVEPAAEAFLDALRGALAQGVTTAPAIGSDIAAPDVREAAYDAMPIAPALSLFEAIRALDDDLPDVRCPVLLLSSRTDHVVPPSAGDHLVSRVTGPVERVWLERSYHVATLDHDRDEVERRAVEFACRVTGG